MHTLERVVEIFPEERREYLDENKALSFSYNKDLWTISLLEEKEKEKLSFLAKYVVFPENEEELKELIKRARKEKIPLIPYGGGSGVCGSLVPLKGGIIVDLKKMDRILSLDPIDLTVEVEPGVIGEVLERYLNRQGFTLGHFPSSIYCSTVGGWLATRASGQLSTQYGSIEDLVLDFRILLGNGEILTLTKAPRLAEGISLKEIFLGSEGTLGIFTRITLKIRPLPPYRDFLGILCKNTEVGIYLIRELLKRGITPAGVRLYDELDTYIIGRGAKKSYKKEHSLKYLLLLPSLTGKAIDLFLKAKKQGALLILTFEGEKEIVEAKKKLAQKIAQIFPVKIEGEEPARYWWEHRYDVSYGTPPVYKQGAFVDTCEVATTWKNLYPLYKEIHQKVSRYALLMAHFSHAYLNGSNIYFTFVGKAKNLEKAKRLYFKIWKIFMETTLKYNGAISHHHGIGLVRLPFWRKKYEKALPIFSAIKKACDPDGILNPGKIFDEKSYYPFPEGYS